jgi:adenylate cyclase
VKPREIGRDEVARRAGVEPEFVERAVNTDVITRDERGTFSDGDVRRVRLLQTLEQGGVPLDRVAELMRANQLSLDFMDMPFYARFASLTTTSFAEAAAAHGVRQELLFLAREAIGFGAPAAEDQMREDELRLAPMIARLLEVGTRPAVVERMLRVYGESMRRIAEVEGDWWRGEVERTIRESGLGEWEAMQEANRLSEGLAELTDGLAFTIYHAHHEHAATKNIIDDIEAALARAGVYVRVANPPAICFLDLAGYTSLTEERGDQAAAEVAERLSVVVRRVSGAHRGKPVKWLGDGVMFHFRDSQGAVSAALQMIDEASRGALPPARVGVHAGPVLFQEGDYFGRTVNVASRVADYARPTELLVTREVVEALGELSSDVMLSSIGSVELKGISGRVELYAVSRSPSAAAPVGVESPSAV